MSELPLAISWPAELVTARLILRPIESADVPAISRLWTDPEVRRYLGGPVADAEVAARQRGCVGARGCFGVLSRSDRIVLGMVLVEPNARGDSRTEVSYSFLPERWGHGYAREAVSATVTWAMADTIATPAAVIAITQQANDPSRRLLESIGMVLISSFVEWGAPQLMYSVDRSELR
jgi:RimJ/RimL family protein N-acetyltransferase